MMIAAARKRAAHVMTTTAKLGFRLIAKLKEVVAVVGARRFSLLLWAAEFQSTCELHSLSTK